MVADNADILATGRSARMGALLGLAGLARWCIMNREGMEFMERTGDRMRVGLTSISSCNDIMGPLL